MAPGVTAQRTGVKKGARLIGKGGPSQGFHPPEEELVKRTWMYREIVKTKTVDPVTFFVLGPYLGPLAWIVFNHDPVIYLQVLYVKVIPLCLVNQSFKTHQILTPPCWRKYRSYALIKQFCHQCSITVCHPGAQPRKRRWGHHLPRPPPPLPTSPDRFETFTLQCYVQLVPLKRDQIL